ncbi:MAG: 2-amino-4-hydroxy-6-hydroxymethyldihydropteridine diphosphokinase [Acidobacteriota bacterium]
MPAVHLGLGSNLGNKGRNLAQACSILSELGVTIHTRSPIYATEPVGFQQQDWFLNQALAVEVDVDARTLLQACLQVESRMGRQRQVPGGPRAIDLDVLLYDDLVAHEPDLIIPHPRMHLRRFVLVPLAVIAPQVIHPVLGKTIERLAAECPDSSQVIPVGSLGPDLH